MTKAMRIAISALGNPLTVTEGYGNEVFRHMPLSTWLHEVGPRDVETALEANYELTKRCLEVCAEFRNPVSIVTKAPLIERDLDVLTELTQKARVSVTVSIPIWDAERARAIEP